MPAAARRAQLVIGLMSGTSFDGVDAALVRVRGQGIATKVELKAFETFPYPPAVRGLVAEVAAAGTVEQVCRANALLGELFAEAARGVADAAGVAMGRVALIGSHGQTVQHLPEPATVAGRAVAGTLQIGEPCVIAERTGVTTVADFRPRDVACGGQGAPLVPWVDYLLFRRRTRGRVLLNIGGIANVTYLPPACRPEQVVAFDTGPGNMLLDALARRLTDGRLSYDRDGTMALAGEVSPPLLRWLLERPYLRREPPKSTGRELFGEPFADRLLARAEGLAPGDVMATAAAFTAESIADAIRRFLTPLGPVDELIASGGGCHHPVVMGRLAEALAPVPVRRTDEFGIPADAKEAVAFAVLAHETMAGRPGNLPSATGAARAAVLGKIVPGRRPRAGPRSRPFEEDIEDEDDEDG
ncbi:MAG: anhydro-N-acetylmuramic acid kinase [Planctomycetota bacterium]